MSKRGAELFAWLDAAIPAAVPRRAVAPAYETAPRFTCPICGFTCAHPDTDECDYSGRRPHYLIKYSLDVGTDAGQAIQRYRAHEDARTLAEPGHHFYRRYREQKRPKYGRGGRR